MLLSRRRMPPVPIEMYIGYPRFHANSLIVVLVIPTVTRRPGGTRPPPHVASAHSVVLTNVYSGPCAPTGTLGVKHRSVGVYMWKPSGPLVHAY